MTHTHTLDLFSLLFHLSLVSAPQLSGLPCLMHSLDPLARQGYPPLLPPLLAAHKWRALLVWGNPPPPSPSCWMYVVGIRYFSGSPPSVFCLLRTGSSRCWSGIPPLLPPVGHRGGFPLPPAGCAWGSHAAVLGLSPSSLFGYTREAQSTGCPPSPSFWMHAGGARYRSSSSIYIPSVSTDYPVVPYILVTCSPLTRSVFQP